MDDDLVVNTTSNLKTYFLHDLKSLRLCRTVLSLLHQKHCILSITLVGSEKMRSLNKKYRRKDSATDVLSFAQLKWQKPPSLKSGGIYSEDSHQIYDDINKVTTSDKSTRGYTFSPTKKRRSSSYRHLVPKVLGDLVLCPQVAAKNAQSLGHGLDRELGFLLVHGILHLCGYDHENKKDELKMVSLQRKIMDEISFSTPPLWRGCIRRVST